MVCCHHIMGQLGGDGGCIYQPQDTGSVELFIIHRTSEEAACESQSGTGAHQSTSLMFVRYDFGLGQTIGNDSSCFRFADESSHMVMASYGRFHHGTPADLGADGSAHDDTRIIERSAELYLGITETEVIDFGILRAAEESHVAARAMEGHVLNPVPVAIDFSTEGGRAFGNVDAVEIRPFQVDVCHQFGFDGILTVLNHLAP